MIKKTIKEIWKTKYEDIKYKEINDMSLKEFMVYDLKFTFLPFVLPICILFIIFIYIIGVLF